MIGRLEARFPASGSVHYAWQVEYASSFGFVEPVVHSWCSVCVFRLGCSSAVFLCNFSISNARFLRYPSYDDRAALLRSPNPAHGTDLSFKRITKGVRTKHNPHILSAFRM